MRLSGACPIPDVFLFCVFLRTSSFTPGLLQLSVRQSILSSQESKLLSFYRPTGFRNIKGMRCAKKPRQVLTTTLLWNRTIAQPFLHVGKIVKWTGKTQLCHTFSPSKSSAIYNAMSQLCSDHRGIFLNCWIWKVSCRRR